MSPKQVANKKGIVIYQAKNGAIELRGDASHETIWATQAQIAELFSVDRSVVTKHIRNVLKDKELDEKSVCAKYAHTAPDGKSYLVQYYNLDLILSVGYRTNSNRAIQFRQWATKTLRVYIVDGFAINKKRIAANYEKFLEATSYLKKLLPAGALVDSGGVLELVSLFAETWLSLDAYDKDTLPKGKLTKKQVNFTSEIIVNSLAEFKQELINKSEATDIFGLERSNGAVAGIVGNVLQSFGGKELYPSAEEKAVHLLYFMVKSHPFIDGNKRSGAFAFVWFLKQASILNVSKLTPAVLTALTILVACSDPKDKQKVVSLILNLISKN